MLLDLSVYANEIWSRMEAGQKIKDQHPMANLGIEIWPNWPEGMKERWEEMKEREVPKEEKGKMELEGQLREMLGEIVDGWGREKIKRNEEKEEKWGGKDREELDEKEEEVGDGKKKIQTVMKDVKEKKEREEEKMPKEVEGKDREKKETRDERDREEKIKTAKDTVKEQMHRNRLAKTLVADQRMEDCWAKLTKEHQSKVITTLFGAENENKKGREQRRKAFGGYLELWKKTREQMELGGLWGGGGIWDKNR